MSYSRRQLYAMGEPLGDSATRREVGGKIIYGGGGGGGTPANTTQQVTQDLPAWAKPYAKESLGKAAALTSTPYQTYGGERFAQFTPMQKNAFDRSGNQQVASQIGTGSGLAGLAGASSFRDAGTAEGFMSPYMQQVVDQQMSSAQRQADIASTQRGARAVGAGAFGGSRQAIENAEANRALASQKGEIQAKGLQSAFEQAQNQFNQEQSTRLNAAQALGQMGQLQYGQETGITDQQFNMGQQQRQATQDILSSQYQDFQNQQRSPYDQLAFMSSLIRGTPMGGTTASYTSTPPPNYTSQMLGLATAGAGAYGAYQGGKGNAAGGVVKSYAAGGIASLNQPELAAMANGMSDADLNQAGQSPANPELAKMTLAAEAQERDELRKQSEALKAKGSMSKITSVLANMPDDKLQQYAKLNKSDPYIMALVVSESNRRKEGGMPAQGQPSVVDQQIASMAVPEDQGIAQLPVGDMEFADGGIVAFAAGDMIPDPIMIDEERKRRAARMAAEPAADPAAPRQPSGDLGIMSLLGNLEKTQRADEEAASKIERDALAADRTALQAKEEEDKMYGADREERLKKRQEEMKGSEKQNAYLTLMNIGLGIAAGDSPDALKNIAAGAQQGLKGFQERLDAIKLNKEKLDDDFSRLYEIRQEKVGATRERLRQLGREEAGLEADTTRRVSAISSAIAGKKIEFKQSEIAANRSFKNARAGSQNMDTQTFEAYVRKHGGDVIKAREEYESKFGKKEPDTYTKIGLESIAQQKAKILASQIPENMKAPQIAALDAEAERLLGNRAAPAGAGGGRMGAPTAAHIDALKKNPSMAAEFDRKFGAGASAQYVK